MQFLNTIHEPIRDTRPIRLVHPLLPELSQFNERLEQIWEARWLSNGGQQQQELTLNLQRRLQQRNLSVFCNGTIALLIGLRALGLKGEVITTPFTFPATVHALEWAGLTPVFCDIDPQTMCLDPRRVEEAITEKTCAILGVHVFGIPCDVFALENIAKKFGLKLIYDAAHAFDVELDKTPIGHFGDMSMFSLHATKMFHSAEGGVLVYRDAHLTRDIYLRHNFGIESEDYVSSSGINGKMNELQAALGLCVLEMLDEERLKRGVVASHYIAGLSECEGVKVVLPDSNVKPSLQYMPVRISGTGKNSRDAIYNKMRTYGIMARRYFSPLCSQFDCYKHLPSSNPQNIPVSHKVVKEILCLPFYGDLNENEVQRVCDLFES